jgi:hypothetical protein
VSRSPAAARKSLETVIWPRHQTNDGGSFFSRSEIEVALTTVSETIPRIDAPRPAMTRLAKSPRALRFYGKLTQKHECKPS